MKSFVKNEQQTFSQTFFSHFLFSFICYDFVIFRLNDSCGRCFKAILLPNEFRRNCFLSLFFFFVQEHGSTNEMLQFTCEENCIFQKWKQSKHLNLRYCLYSFSFLSRAKLFHHHQHHVVSVCVVVHNMFMAFFNYFIKLLQLFSQQKPHLPKADETLTTSIHRRKNVHRNGVIATVESRNLKKKKIFFFENLQS